MDLGLDGLRVLVTAGANGIGLAIARAFVAEGARVHVVDVDRAALGALADTDPALTASAGDVSDRADCARFTDEAVAALGGLDVLVNNAGIAGPTAPVEAIDPAEWDRCLAVTLTGQFNCARLAIPHLRRSRNGSVVNLSSAAGRFGYPLRAAYAAAKWGVVGFTKSLSRELGPDGIRVNAILPGPVAGERIERVIAAKARERGQAPDAVEAEYLSHASIPAFVTADEIARQVLFLCGPGNKTLSGQAIAIDGDLQAVI